MNFNTEDKNYFKQEFKKRCFNFSILVLKLSQDLRNNPLNFSLIDQLIRSATSIGANVVEGGSGSTRKEFINFFQIALKSASETLYWLAIIKEVNPKYKEKIDTQIKECIEIKKILSTIILNTKRNSTL